MIKNKKIIIFMPARNTAHLLEKTYDDIPKDFADEIILVDNASSDNTVEVAHLLGMKIIIHENNLGYGGSLKTGYSNALREDADVVVMLHSDYQYDPKVLPEMVEPIVDGKADAVFGSRLLGGAALEGGMPFWKYFSNIFLNKLINRTIGSNIAEFHTGYRAFSRSVLRSIPFRYNSDSFLFDTEIIIQIVKNNFKIMEIPITTRYLQEASTMTISECIIYGIGIFKSLSEYTLHKRGIIKSKKYGRISEYMPEEASM